VAVFTVSNCGGICKIALPGVSGDRERAAQATPSDSKPLRAAGVEQSRQAPSLYGHEQGGQTPAPPDSATSRPAPRGVCNCFHMESRPRKSKAELSFIGAATAGGRAGTPAATCGAITPPAPIFTHREIFKAGQGTAGTNRGTFADCFSGRVWPKKHFALAFFGVYPLAVFSPPGRCKRFFCSRDRAGH